MLSRNLYLFLAVLSFSVLQAEDTDEEMIDLSPFEITSSDVSYEPLKNVGISESVYASAPVPVTITRRADAVYIQLLLINADSKQELRNADLQKAVNSITDEVQKLVGFRVEQREIKLSTENRKVLSSYRGSSVSSSQLVVFADLGVGETVAGQLRKVREALLKVRLPGSTKLRAGVVGLYVKNPNQYRRELIDKIFEDIEYLKTKVGAEFEVQPSGFGKQVAVKASSETDVELWVDYSVNIRSIREISAKK